MSTRNESIFSIFVRDLPTVETLRWAEQLFGALHETVEAGEATVYHFAAARLIVTPQIEGGSFTEICFSATDLPWLNLARCAHSTARSLRREVLFEPADEGNPYVWVSVTPNGVERLTEWLEGQEPRSQDKNA